MHAHTLGRCYGLLKPEFVFRDSMTVTILGNPNAVKEVSYSRIKDMNFQGKVTSWKCCHGLNKVPESSQPAFPSPAKSDSPNIIRWLPPLQNLPFSL